MRPDYEPGSPPWETLIAKYALLDETDTLLEAAIELAQKNDSISASYLQRRLRLGYPRAARLMEHLYEMGLVEDPKTGGKTRKTLTDEDDDPLQRMLSER
jgi:S-DNA-T family DNA segregation ATPase FtsK/SpoIIIE